MHSPAALLRFLSNFVTPSLTGEGLSTGSRPPAQTSRMQQHRIGGQPGTEVRHPHPSFLRRGPPGTCRRILNPFGNNQHVSFSCSYRETFHDLGWPAQNKVRCGCLQTTAAFAKPQRRDGARSSLLLCMAAPQVQRDPRPGLICTAVKCPTRPERLRGPWDRWLRVRRRVRPPARCTAA